MCLVYYLVGKIYFWLDVRMELQPRRKNPLDGPYLLIGSRHRVTNEQIFIFAPEITL